MGRKYKTYDAGERKNAKTSGQLKMQYVSTRPTTFESVRGKMYDAGERKKVRDMT